MMAKPQRHFEVNPQASIGLRWCAGCGQEYWMVTPESAAAIAGVDTLAIYERAYGGRVHSAETCDEQILICLNSLLR